MGEAAAAGLEAQGDYDLVTFEDLDLTDQDATGARFTDCTFARCTVEGVHLDDARVLDSTVDAVHGGTLHAPGSTWQDVVLRDCRLGAVAWYGAELTRVEIRGGKLDYLNLRDAELTDVVLTGCVVGELDLAGARVARLRIDDCRVQRLDLTRAQLRDADLRGVSLSRLDGVAGLAGAVISEEQLVELAPALADHLGIVVR